MSSSRPIESFARCPYSKAVLSIALLLSSGLHLLALRSLSILPSVPDRKTRQEHLLTVHLSPGRVIEKAPPAASATTRPMRDKPPGASTRTQASRDKQDNPSRNIAEETAPLPAASSRSMDDIIQNAKRDIGKIDKELRGTLPSLNPTRPTSIQSQLEKGIAAAGRPATQVLAERTLPDGQRVTRVSGPNGVYCVTYGTAGATGGLDVMQRGVPSKVTNCDNLFD